MHNIASSRALIGHLLLRANDAGAALPELEISCPTLWKFKASWRSMETDVRLMGCFMLHALFRI